MTRAKIETLENKLFDKIVELDNTDFCHVSIRKLTKDVELLIEVLKVIKQPINNPRISKIN